MAAPVYTTDLSTLNTGESTTGWTEPTNATAGGVAVAEVDRFIQGTGCISKTFNATGLGGLAYTNGSAVVIPTDGAFFAWVDYTSPNATDTYTNGGQRLLIGNSTSAYKAWYVAGSDTNTYGGWKCLVANPTVTADDTVGTPTTTTQVFGYVISSINAVAKGNPFGIDVIRYGRGQALFTEGDATTSATFEGFMLVNDNTSNRWGLIQNQGGSYLIQGLIQFGNSTTATYFKDANKVLTIADNRKVTANFNTFEVQNASSYVELNNISVQALGTTSKGRWITTDNATVALNFCTFIGMNTFGFASNTSISSSTFRNCGQITQNSATFDKCLIDNSSASMISNNPSVITNCSFICSSNHAIEITEAGTYSFSGNSFSGYGANDTATSAIYNNSGGAVTLNISNGTTPTVTNGTGSTTTINNAVTLTILASVSLVGAEIRIYDLDNNPANSLGTELAGIESCATVSYTYSGDGGNSIWIQIMKSGYEEFGQQLTIPSSNGNFTALLNIDTNT